MSGITCTYRGVEEKLHTFNARIHPRGESSDWPSEYTEQLANSSRDLNDIVHRAVLGKNVEAF